MKHYAERDPEELEPHYSQHVGAMTSEALHSKADIAAELAYRDQIYAECYKDLTDETLRANDAEARNELLERVLEIANGIQALHKGKAGGLGQWTELREAIAACDQTRRKP